MGIRIARNGLGFLAAPATLGVGLLLISASRAGAADALPAPTVAQAPASHHCVVPHGQTVTLADCIRIALENQPLLAAYRASYANAQARVGALDRLIIPTCLRRDLPYRRQQAGLGVVIAGGAVNQWEQETIYAVTRTYYSVIYARQQLALVERSLGALKKFKVRAKELVDAGRTDVTTRHVARMDVYIHLGEARREEAGLGSQRALAALQEAMGLAPGCCIHVPDGELPYPTPDVCCENIVELALARRGEIVQVVNAAQVVALEIQAQGAKCGLQAETFSMGRDPGAQQVPQGERNAHYRPGAVSIEMPPKLVGHRSARVEQATILHGRAAAVVDKTRNLIALEASDVYLKYLEASRKLVKLRKAAEHADKLARGLREDLLMQVGKVDSDDVLGAGAQATQFKADANEQHFHYVLALAALERVTAGGFPACLAGPVAATDEDEPEVPEK